MKHRNITTEEWSRMAIDFLFERGTLPDWREFSLALRSDERLARETLFMCERHHDGRSAALARVLVEHFHSSMA
ncbi:MAG: hypothetical protein M3R15_06120 [Acidobacteriota bacterium]|nr:hypothetical protein [Acidobacteriota bacterium]